MAEQSNNTQNQKENDIIGRIYFNKFKVTKKIGQGSFGQVYQGVNLKNNEPVALKFVNYLRFNLGIEKRKQQSARNWSVQAYLLEGRRSTQGALLREQQEI